jgi:diphosphomevalonate decarboxylase
LDTYPPIHYLSDDSYKIIEKCHEFNEEGVRLAYTFDAGPNPFILTLKKYYEEVLSFFKEEVGFKILEAK